MDPMDLMRLLARRRVPLGFACAAISLALARPTLSSLAMGLAVAAVGELLRIWASGHIEKGREVTRSGPYHFVRHPLYFGSAIIGLGFMIAARSLVAAALVSIYLLATFAAAIRSEEATLDARFGGEYAAYRDGRATPVARAFSLARVAANKEYRAVIGLAIGFAVLYWRAQ